MQSPRQSTCFCPCCPQKPPGGLGQVLMPVTGLKGVALLALKHSD